MAHSDTIRILGLSEQTVISTDDEVVAAEAIKLGFAVPTLWPSYLAQDKTSTFDVLKHVLADIEKRQKWSPKYVLLLQITSPFRDPKIISRAIDLIQKRKNFPRLYQEKLIVAETKRLLALRLIMLSLTSLIT